ncbi:MAG: PD40 domain-containing protein, partial [Candidatus Heimdallarchaeota archaeon]|nr:PD40 domain-containing protein [Candidatus Heimdallarchaeota archaeon]
MRKISFATLTMLLCLTTFLVADTDTKINLENILTDDSPIVRLRYPSISPDGTMLAFSSQGNIWIASVDGSNARRVSAHPAREIKPIWMPNSKELIYIGDYAGNFDIYRISIDGGKPIRLTSYPTSEYPTEVTPDGKYVFFYSTRESRSDIFFTSTEKMMTPVRLMHTYWDSETYPTVTADMKHVAFTVNG